MKFGPGLFISLSGVRREESEMLKKISNFIWWQLEESSMKGLSSRSVDDDTFCCWESGHRLCPLANEALLKHVS